MKTTKQTVTLALSLIAGLSFGPLARADDDARHAFAPAMQVLAPAAHAAAELPAGNDTLAAQVAPGLKTASDWQAWAAERHAQITARLLRETEQRIIGLHDHGPQRLAGHGF